MGGTLYGALTDLATFDIVVRRAASMRRTVIRDGAVAAVVAITADEQTVSYETPIGSGGLVRVVEVRGEPTFGGPEAPLASRTDLKAFSYPVFPPAGPTAGRHDVDLGYRPVPCARVAGLRAVRDRHGTVMAKQATFCAYLAFDEEPESGGSARARQIDRCCARGDPRDRRDRCHLGGGGPLR
jgi:hypothetical protein